MQRRLHFHNALLLLACLAWAGLWVSDFLLPAQKAFSKEEFFAQYKSIEGQQQKQIAQAEVEAMNAQQVVEHSAKIRFNLLNEQTKLPLFIWEEGRMYYWNNTRINANTQWLSDSLPFQIYQQEENLYLLLKKTYSLAGKRYFMVQALPLVISNPPTISNIPKEYAFPELANFKIIANPPANDTLWQVKTAEGKVLYSLKLLPISLEIESSSLKVSNSIFRSYLHLFALVISFGWVFSLIQLHFSSKGKFRQGFIALLLSLGLLRFFLLRFQFPEGFWPIHFYSSLGKNAAFLGVNSIVLFVNLIVACIGIIYVYRYFLGSRLYGKLTLLKPALRIALGSSLIAGNYLLIYYLYLLFREILHAPETKMEIDINTLLSAQQFFTWGLLVFIGGVFFLSSHTLLRMVLALTQSKYGAMFLVCLLGLSLSILIALGFSMRYLLLVPLNGIFVIAVLFPKLPRNLNEFQFENFVYLIAFAAVVSVVATYALRNQVQHDLYHNKKRFAELLFTPQKAEVEGSILQTAKLIARDAKLLQQFSKPAENTESIKRRIQRYVPFQAFKGYQVEAFFLKDDGSLLDSSLNANARLPKYSLADTLFQDSLIRILKDKSDKKSKGEYSLEFFAPQKKVKEAQNKDSISSYNSLKDSILQSTSAWSAKPILILRFSALEVLSEKTQFSNLFNYSTLNDASTYAAFSYAIYDSAQLIKNEGNYNYARNFPNSLLNEKELFKSGLLKDEYQHFAVRSTLEPSQIIVISNGAESVKSFLVRFCLFFLCLLFIILFIQFARLLLASRSNKTLSISTKIQLFLNAAFLLPLIVGVALSLSVMSSSYKKETYESYLNKAQELAQFYAPTFDKLKEPQFILGELKNQMETLSEMGKLSNLDLSVYFATGDLSLSTQPKLFEQNYLSTKINPVAIASLIEARQNGILIDEQIGKLKYKSAYVTIKSVYRNAIIGMLWVPFFESDVALTHQLSDVAGSLIILFTVLLLLFLLLSFWAAKQLTAPLKLLTRRLKRMNLDKNKPIEWKRKDEIGLLVAEYNNMLSKLNASKEALKRNEKESAWREMAKQVAHEIKNPLTPMKLSLEFAKQALLEQHPQKDKILEKSLNTLLTQIDILSDIAGSFAAFAQMPTPQNQQFDLLTTLESCIALFEDNPEVEVVFANLTAQSTLPITGDKKLMNRIVNNLILNAIQAAKENEALLVYIELSLDEAKEKITLSLKDNGKGIDPSIADKVFIPNFSTKNGGSGIGLAVAKRGIEHQGGSIWFETKENIGTTFFIELRNR